METQEQRFSSLRRGLQLYDLLLPDQWQTARKLGEHLSVDERTVKSYASVLMSYGWPVQSRGGRGYGYRLDPAADHSLRLTSRDLFTLAIMLTQGSSTLPDVEADKLKAKLKSLLPEQSRGDLSDLEELIAVQGFAPKDWDLVDLVAVCLKDRRYALLIDYERAQGVRRRVLPLQIRSQSGAWYLDLYDLDKLGHRSFRFDRIQKVVLHRQDRPYDEPPANTFVTHKWDFGSGETHEVCLEITDALAAWLRENPEHPTQKIDTRGQLWFVTYRVRRLELFADWAIGLRGARVAAPERLLLMIEERARSWLSSYGTLNVAWEK